MKKFVALILMLCLLCISAAVAEEVSGTLNNTAVMTISYKVTSGYTTVIPADFTINESDFTVSEDGTFRSGTFDITVKGGGTMEAGQEFVVLIYDSTNNFNLAYDENKIPYGLYVDGASTEYQLNENIFQLTEMPENDQTKTITIKFNNTAPVAGTYTDRITFYMGFQ